MKHGSSEPWIANTDVLNTQGTEAARAWLIYEIEKEEEILSLSDVIIAIVVFYALRADS